MLGSLYIGKVFGIRISIHWTFLILIGYIVISSSRDGDTIWQALTLVGFTLAVFACITLHELGHSLTARRFGIQTRAITLLPIGGLASLERMPEKPGQELAVAIAGPLVNIAIGAVIIAALFFLGLIPTGVSTNGSLLEVVGTAPGFLFYLAVTNIVLALFNLVPAFPMDGGRVLRAILTFWMKRVKATQIAANIGQVIAVGYIGYCLIKGQWTGAILGLFVFTAARAEYQQVKTESLMGGFTVRDILMTNFTIFHPYQRIQEAVQKMLSSSEKNFLVIKDQHFEGVLTSKNIEAGLATVGGDEMIGRVLTKNAGVLDINDSIAKALELFRKTSLPLLPVVENGRLAGVVDIDNVNEFLNVQEAVKR